MIGPNKNYYLIQCELQEITLGQVNILYITGILFKLLQLENSLGE